MAKVTQLVRDGAKTQPLVVLDQRSMCVGPPSSVAGGGLVAYTGAMRQPQKVSVLKTSPNSINQIVPGADFYSGFNLETLSYVNILRYNSETQRAIDNASLVP